MAIPISPSSSAVFSGAFSEEVTELLFELNFGASGNYALYTTGEDMDSYGEYLDSDGVTVLLENDDGDVDYNFMISPIEYESGVRYLKVTPYDEDSYGITFSLFFVLLAAPTVTTNNPSYLSSFAAKLSGTVVSDGGGTITEYGFYWGLTNEPATQVLPENEPFEYTIGGLSPETTYYYKAYAINLVGTGYGEVISFTTPSAAAYSENWPRFKRDNKNTGLSPLAGPINNTVKWSKYVSPTEYSYNFGLVVDSDDIAYFINSRQIGGSSVYVHSILLVDGTTLWTLEIPGNGPYDFVDNENSLTISPDGTTLYLGDSASRLYAINKSDGSIIWTVTATTGGRLGTPTVAPDGTIYISSSSGYILAFDPTDGTELWIFSLESVTVPNSTYFIKKEIAVDSAGKIYATGSRYIYGHLVCLNSDGSVEWVYTRADTYSYPNAGPSIGPDGTAYFCTSDHCLVAVDSAGGLIWEYSVLPADIGAYPYGCPTIGNTGIIYFASFYDYLFAVNPDGTLAWQVECIGAEPCSPVVDKNENIYISSTNASGGSFQSRTFAFTSAGVKLWQSSTSQVTINTPAISSNGFMVICSQYYIHVFESGGVNRFDWTYKGYYSGALVPGTEKVKGYGFYVSAVEWNALIDAVTLMYTQKGLPNPGLTKVSAAQSFTATLFNQVRAAIGSVQPTGILDKVPGDFCVAADFNQLRTSLNLIT